MIQEGQFPTDSRIHISLNVRDLVSSVSFYEKLLGMPPIKTRPGYAKFESHEPALNLALMQSSGPQPAASALSHLGIQVKSSAAVASAARRLESLGLATRAEKEVDCCYAIQDKTWVADPDGNQWEFFVVLDPGRSLESMNCETTDCCTTGILNATGNERAAVHR